MKFDLKKFSKIKFGFKKEQAKELNNVLPLIKSNLEEKTEELKSNAINANIPTLY